MPWRRGRVGSVELRPDGVNHVGGQDGFAVEEAIEVLEQGVGFGAFEQVADRTAGDGFDEVLFVVGAGEDGDADVGVTGGEGTRDLKGVHAGKTQFREDEVRLGLDDELERGTAVSGLADNLVATRVEQGGDSLANERLVVDKDDLHCDPLSSLRGPYRRTMTMMRV